MTRAGTASKLYAETLYIDAHTEAEKATATNGEVEISWNEWFQRVSPDHKDDEEDEIAEEL
jgi:hypothetical protein